jgi:hypothetical protein
MAQAVENLPSKNRMKPLVQNPSTVKRKKKEGRERGREREKEGGKGGREGGKERREGRNPLGLKLSEKDSKVYHPFISHLLPTFHYNEDKRIQVWVGKAIGTKEPTSLSSWVYLPARGSLSPLSRI